MPLGTVDRTPPPFFKQGASALSKLMVFSALALLLMVLDVRLQLAAPLRSVIAASLYPLQWLSLQPVHVLRSASTYLESLQEAQQQAEEAQAELVRQVRRAALVEHLEQENRELRALLKLREHLPANTTSAEVLYDAGDPYTRKVVIDRGQAHGLAPGSAVMDAYGVLGQVTRVYPLVSEVTLLIDRDQAIPVLNTRTGQRSLAYGQVSRESLRLEIRFATIETDVKPGDLLTTSGVDEVYPPGLPVARVVMVDHPSESGFAHIECEPLARMDNAMRLLVLAPVGKAAPDTPQAAAAAADKRTKATP